MTIGSVFHVIPEKLDEEEHPLDEKAKSVVLHGPTRPEDLKESEDRKSWSYNGIVAYSKICTHVGCPVALYEQQTHHLLCPCHQSTFDVADGAKVVFGPAKRPLPQLPITVDDEGYLIAQSDFDEPVGPSFWERLTVTTTSTPSPVEKVAAGTADYLDQRTGIGTAVKVFARKIFPDHWSFLLGEIALYSFVTILISGHLPHALLRAEHERGRVRRPVGGRCRASHMSEAFASTLRLSFEVRGGLLMRQIHHWAALIFMAAIVTHMMRVFFTGAFRKPRELNWVVGFTLMILGLAAGFSGYSLPDDVLSGNGLRITDGVVRSIPIIGSYTSYFLFGGEFPGDGADPAPVHGAHPPDARASSWRSSGCTCSSSCCTSTRSTRARAGRTRTSSATRSSRSTWRRPAATSSSCSASSR